MLPFAEGIAAGALSAALLLLVTIVVERALRRWRHARLRRVEEQWRGALQQAAEDPHAARLEPISDLDLPYFLALWNHSQEAQAGEGANRLGTLLALHGLDARALKLMGRPSARLRIIGINAAGHLREASGWARLEKIAQHRDPVTSFAAALALLRIDSRRALDLLALSIPERADWPLARLASVFESLGPAVVTAPIVAMLLRRPRSGLDRVGKLARFGYRERIATIVLGWLGSSTDPEVIIVALDYVDHRSDLSWAHGAAEHSEWRVRLAAARALGRVGGREELARLLALLRDPVWWVRYHSAQALTRLEGLEPFELENLRENARDAFAADMLGQALAERRWT
ncbi:MAG: HEAT repeat domain-containing protein [Pseudomonadota bacterium]|nr:HEAT repeat domain-containing protein [Pseudomonadota bacterium]